MDDNERAFQAFLKVHAKMVDDLSTFYWDAFTALNINGISGDYVEFGSLGATSIKLAHDVVAATTVPRHLWAFDSFEGLPEPTGPLDIHPAFSAGGRHQDGREGLEKFVAQCDEHGIPREAYTTVPGFYEDSLPPLGDDGGPTDIALAYVDCNMYSSTVAVLAFLTPRLKHGMILAFDDYYCWSADDVSGERAALDEFLVDHPEWHLARFKDPTWSGVSFVVEQVRGGSRPRRP